MLQRFILLWRGLKKALVWTLMILLFHLFFSFHFQPLYGMNFFFLTISYLILACSCFPRLLDCDSYHVFHLMNGNYICHQICAGVLTGYLYMVDMLEIYLRSQLWSSYKEMRMLYLLTFVPRQEIVNFSILSFVKCYCAVIIILLVLPSFVDFFFFLGEIVCFMVGR